MAKTFQCTLVTPQQQVLDEEVTYASIPAWDGQIGVAPQRAPLLVQLGEGPLRLSFESGIHRWYFLSGGFAQMKDNRLTLLSDEALPPEEIDRKEVESEFSEAQALLAVGDQQAEQRARRLARARGKLRLLNQN